MEKRIISYVIRKVANAAGAVLQEEEVIQLPVVALTGGDILLTKIPLPAKAVKGSKNVYSLLTRYSKKSEEYKRHKRGELWRSLTSGNSKQRLKTLWDRHLTKLDIDYRCDDTIFTSPDIDKLKNLIHDFSSGRLDVSPTKKKIKIPKGEKLLSEFTNEKQFPFHKKIRVRVLEETDEKIHVRVTGNTGFSCRGKTINMKTATKNSPVRYKKDALEGMEYSFAKKEN